MDSDDIMTNFRVISFYMSGKKVLITGATGLLGRAAVKAFENAGFQVFGIGLSRVTKESTNLRKCDLRSELDTRKLFKEIKPDVVVHW